jgi:hypothetical protein
VVWLLNLVKRGFRSVNVLQDVFFSVMLLFEILFTSDNDHKFTSDNNQLEIPQTNDDRTLETSSFLAAVFRTIFYPKQTLLTCARRSDDLK